MKPQIENLKQQLREFIELSKTITPRWKASDNVIVSESTEGYYLATFDGPRTSMDQDPKNALFAARSRNISPAMAECLLVTVNGLDRLYDDTEGCADGAPDAADHDKLCNEIAHAAKFHLQQILTIWEAAK